MTTRTSRSRRPGTGSDSLEFRGRQSFDSDPFSHILRPPPGETEEERARRIHSLQEAQRISREIDQSILESKKLYDQRKKAVKILLLGQSESGKSTTLKNFKLAFAPAQFRSERAAWRTIIQLNVIGSVKRLLDVLSDEFEYSSSSPPGSLGRTASSQSVPRPKVLTDEHRRIRMRLSPLLSVETSLSRKLFPDNVDRERVPELCVRAGGGWKTIVERATSPPGPSVKKGRSHRPGTSEGKNTDDPTNILAACRDDIVSLWEDPAVQAVLSMRNVRLDQAPGFFLNDAGRIAVEDYDPTDSDIVRARLRTYGVEEHHLIMEAGPVSGQTWYFYDVGGSRSMRPHWVPYFDDVQAIIFLAPLAFNQVLEEDPQVNRLQDSIHLWQEVCANPLLSQSNLILFLNKMDILAANLNAGILVRKYVPSYGDAPNDVPHVTKYFKDKFHAYQKRLSPKPRPFFCHETSVVDTNATRAILVGVQEGILRSHLAKINVI